MNNIVVITQDGGSRTEIVLSRTPEWIAEHQARVGETIFLNMPEMGCEGEAEVMSIGPAPPVDPGTGRVITGVFRHSHGIVYDLKVAGEDETIGVTALHPFWSVDRQAWVAAEDLEIGERLKTMTATAVVESFVRRQSPEAVFNVEVDGDHVYRVGCTGILVHNLSDCCSLFDINHFGGDYNTCGVTYLPMRQITCGPFNHQSRAQGVDARLGKKCISGGQPPGCDPVGWNPNANTRGQRVIIARLHLLGKTLGGSGNCDNLVTGCHDANQEMYNRIEREVRRRVNSGQLVDYEVRAVYDTNCDAIPSSITIRAMAEEDGNCWFESVTIHLRTNLQECI